jgi:hypothetical protein
VEGCRKPYGKKRFIVDFQPPKMWLRKMRSFLCAMVWR